MRDDILIQAIDNTEDVLLHGGRWSEEAKQRVRQARRAGRRVSEMFGDLYRKGYKKAKKAYNAPISTTTTGYESHMAKPMYSVKNKNGTTTKYYEGTRSMSSTSRSLKDYVHGRKGKTRKSYSEGQYAKTFDKKGKLKSTQYRTNAQLMERGNKRMTEIKRRRNSR